METFSWICFPFQRVACSVFKFTAYPLCGLLNDLEMYLVLKNKETYGGCSVMILCEQEKQPRLGNGVINTYFGYSLSSVTNVFSDIAYRFLFYPKELQDYKDKPYKKFGLAKVFKYHFKVLSKFVINFLYLRCLKLDRDTLISLPYAGRCRLGVAGAI